ncbi:MAG: hypothetical protein L5655_11905 [Thermosediminibacteraceae bacterium]|nr:hypothetical protein [Thermosediminibacteraceae bacterium]
MSSSTLRFWKKEYLQIYACAKCLSVGTGMALGLYLEAYIRDATGGYFWARILAVIMRLLGTCFALLGLCIYKKKYLIVNKVS